MIGDQTDVYICQYIEYLAYLVFVNISGICIAEKATNPIVGVWFSMLWRLIVGSLYSVVKGPRIDA